MRRSRSPVRPPRPSPRSAKSRLTLLSQRPSSEPGRPACTQSCPQSSEPGKGAPDPQDHPYHEVRLPTPLSRQEATLQVPHPLSSSRKGSHGLICDFGLIHSLAQRGPSSVGPALADGGPVSSEETAQ